MRGGFGGGADAALVKCLGGFSLRVSGAIERATAGAQNIEPRIFFYSVNQFKASARGGNLHSNTLN
jgi:hypothetical protein